MAMAIGTQQQLQQLQPERDLTIVVMVIVIHRQQTAAKRGMTMETLISKQHYPFIIIMDIRANEEREGMQAMQRREGRAER